MWSGAGTNLRSVLVKTDIPHPVKSIFYPPVPADVSGEVLGGGLLGGQTGDAMDDLLGGSLTVQSTDVASYPEHLGCVGEGDRRLAGDRRNPGGALLGSTVDTVERDVLRGEVAGRAGHHLLAGG